VWISVALLYVPYLVAMRRRRGQNPGAGRKIAFFTAGVLAFWLVTDWPVGLLAASYLAWVQMAQFMLYVMVVAPLLLLGTPEWMGRRILSRLRLYRVVRWLARPLVAGLIYNGLLLLTHAPWTVDVLRANQLGSVVMDSVWLFMGLLLWLPIISPLPEHTRASYPVKIAYIFLAAGVVPAVPAGFLTFAPFPLYAVFEQAPPIISRAVDQQAAGLVMKLGGVPIVWGTMLALMIKWSQEPAGLRADRTLPARPPSRAPGAGPARARRPPGSGQVGPASSS
jgi:putative membrane protein